MNVFAFILIILCGAHAVYEIISLVRRIVMARKVKKRLDSKSIPPSEEEE